MSRNQHMAEEITRTSGGVSARDFFARGCEHHSDYYILF